MKQFLILPLTLLLGACATKFPTPDNAPYTVEATVTDRADTPSTTLKVSGNDLFAATLRAHGGDHLDKLQDVSVGITGQWKQLIRRIQPLVTDFTYRVDSQERLLPKERVYAVTYQGPAGNKYVFRTPDEIRVQYNENQSFDGEVLSSTALTADAFHLFLLGPLALADWQGQYVRISDGKLNGESYYRAYLKRSPGFGLSSSDEIVLWIDPETSLTKMVQITLLGHESTRAAHVEVEYLSYLVGSKKLLNV